jgi:hypothetical protein
VKGATQRSVLRREARAREFVVVARLIVFKQVAVGKPNVRSFGEALSW